MSVHILLDSTFFQTSVSIAAQQRLLPIPANRGLSEGDTIFLRDDSGALTWVADVQMTGEVHGTTAWSGAEEPPGRYAIVGYLARIHSGIVPAGKSRLQSPWVTLNSRTLENALPWWNTHVLLYHSTLHLIEGLLTLEEVQQGLEEGCLVQHDSGHVVVPHGEARKRLLVNIQGVDLVCSLCGGPIASLDEATQDHIIPLSQGGPDALANIDLCHRSCNELKGNALPEQYPPMFPSPGRSNGWRPPQFRNGRHVHPRRGRRQQTRRTARTTFDATLPLRGTGAVIAAEPDNQQTPQLPTEVEPRTAATPTVEKPALLDDRAANDPPETLERSESTKATSAAEGSSGTVAKQPNDRSESTKNGVVEVDPTWLESIQQCGWSQLTQFAAERDWASKTASLRTLEQLPRSDIKHVQASGKLIAEAEGQKGTFRLYEWNSQFVLTEQRGNRQSHFLVKRVNAISWETYLWYLTRFGRTTPLAAAMSLLPLWRQGKPDSDGTLSVTKTGIPLTMSVTNDQLVVVEREVSPDVA